MAGDCPLEFRDSVGFAKWSALWWARLGNNLKSMLKLMG